MIDWLFLKLFVSLPFLIKAEAQLLMLPKETQLLKKDAVVRRSSLKYHAIIGFYLQKIPSPWRVTTYPTTTSKLWHVIKKNITKNVKTVKDDVCVYIRPFYMTSCKSQKSSCQALKCKETSIGKVNMEL